jgi:hypothetical protein
MNPVSALEKMMRKMIFLVERMISSRHKDTVVQLGAHVQIRKIKEKQQH